MAVKAYRVDARLVHGQTVASWIPWLRTKKVVCIGQQAAHDDAAREIISISAVPSDCEINLWDVDQALAEWERNRFGPKSTLVIFQSVDDAFACYERGMKFTELNVCNLYANAETKPLFQVINLTDSQKHKLDKLLENGVDLFYLAMPTNVKYTLKKYLKKWKDG